MNMTTAEALGQYRRDLIEQRIDPTLIDSLVRQAGFALIRGGELVVSEASPSGCCRRPGPRCCERAS